MGEIATAAQGTPVLRTYLELDPDHPATRGVIVSAHKGHRATMAPFAYLLERNDFFTGQQTRAHADHRSGLNILWAVNHSRAPHRSVAEFAPRPRVRVILQSDVEPCFDRGLSADLDELCDAMITEPVIRRYVPATEVGSVIEYQIVVNPRQNDRRGGRNRTVVARTEDKVLSWWVRKSSAAGLSLAADPIIDEPGKRRLHKTSRDPSKADIDTDIEHIRITGKATITDPAAYAHAAHSGIGAARSYGCGLLLMR